MNPGLLIDLFKVYFLWGNKRAQKQKIVAFIKEHLTLSLLINLFHAISIIATALFIMPYMQNSIEGAFYAMGKSLSEFGIEDKMTDISFYAGIIFASILEIGTVHVASKVIEEKQRYSKSILKDATTWKKWAITLSILILLQVGTAVGGLMNFYTLVTTSKADRMLVSSKKRELDNITKEFSILQHKINSIQDGSYKPTHKELEIAKQPKELTLLKSSLEQLEASLAKAKKNHEEFKAAILAKKSSYYKYKKYGKKHLQKFAENKIIKHEQRTVTPLLKQVTSLKLKIASLSNIKTELTESEYLQKLQEKLKVIAEQRNIAWKHIKYLERKMSLNDQKGSSVFFLFLGFALFIVVVQAFLENLGAISKAKMYRYLDALDPARAREREERQSKFNIEDVEKEIQKADKDINDAKEVLNNSNNFIYDYTQKVLEYMQDYYEKSGELPSAKETAAKLELKDYEVKNARRELRKNFYYKEENSKTEPLEKFFNNEGNQDNQGNHL